jgi:hypothetical protein
LLLLVAVVAQFLTLTVLVKVVLVLVACVQQSPQLVVAVL